VALLLLAALAVAAAVLLATASRAADPPGPPQTTTVRPGDTLWSVAQRHAPGDEPFAVIEEIRSLNRLPDYTVHPGQRLVLPARR
jgi:LysM repeat protein